MDGKIINPEWRIETVYSEITKFCVRNGNKLKVFCGGLKDKPIVDIAVPPGKEWQVHIHIEIQEKPEVKP